MPPKKNRGPYSNYSLTVDGEQRQPNMTQKKKKTPKNAFYFYMQDFREAQETRGIFYKTQKEVAEAAASSWEHLSAEERKPYQDAAKEAKEKDKSDLHNKFTTEGKSYAMVNQEEQERIQHHQQMLNEIRSTIRSLRTPPALSSYPFHLIHVNYYCKTLSGLYVPCELAVSEFTLLDGVKRLFHVLINPGDLPLGYKYESEKHSEETHKIPMPNDFQFEGVVRDYPKIFQCLQNFLREAKAEYKLPPLYTTASQVEACENVLTNLCDSVNEDNIFRVFSAKEMFFELQHACVDVFNAKCMDESVVKLPFSSLAERELEKDIFDYTEGISCKFHQETEAIPFCSSSSVQRWIYLILDYCHQATKMPLIPGKHVPVHTNVQFKKLRPLQQQKKKDKQTLSSEMQNLNVNDTENFTSSSVQSGDLNVGGQSGGHTASYAGALRAPKQISEAMHQLSRDGSDDEFPPLGS